MSRMSKLQGLFWLVFPSLVFAKKEVGIGGFANEVQGLLDTLIQAISGISIVLGIAFLVTAVIKYFEYKRSPMMVTIGTVFFFVVAGLILVVLPFAHMFFDRLTGNFSSMVR